MPLSGGDMSILQELDPPAYYGQITERGLIDGFPEGLKYHRGNAVNCETSSIVFDGQNLIFASDKPIPGKARSSVFGFKLRYTSEGNLLTKPVFYITGFPFIHLRKLEDFTLTLDGKYIIATTAFDRVKPKSAKWNPYNTILIWPKGLHNRVKIVAASTVDGFTSSVSLREKFSKALKTETFPDGVPYFKIEGLTVIPGNRLLFGIREMGKTYKNFNYAIKIIEVSYKISGAQLYFTSEFKLIYEYTPAPDLNLARTVGLSSLEYDRFNKYIYMTTSFEKGEEGKVADEDLGGYLWIIPMHYLSSGKSPILVRKAGSERPLLFAHKVEGVSVITKKRVILIHDDDRVLGRKSVVNPEIQFSRNPHQAAYTIVDF
ncbi:hypothetical protein ACFL35_20240 [Candidatus Riflebacteria bacterium]